MLEADRDVFERIHYRDQSVTIRIKASMNGDILFVITSKLGNQDLEVFSHIPEVWEQVMKFQEDQLWWYIRTEQLVGRELKRRIEADWREAYRILSQFDLKRKHKSIPGSLANEVLIEIGKYGVASCWRCGEENFSWVEIPSRRGADEPSSMIHLCDQCRTPARRA